MKTKIKRILLSSTLLGLSPGIALAQKIPDVNLPNTPITQILTNIMNWLLAIVGIIAIISFIITGIMYILAGGNEERITTAKRMLVYSIIGVVVSLMGLIIVTAIEKALSGASLF